MTDKPDHPTQLLSQGAPSVYSNKFVVTCGPDSVRVIFGQVFAADEAAHAGASVVMGVGDARELAEVILRLTGSEKSK